MKREDKFGRPIYSDTVWNQMVTYGRILIKIGYSESYQKPNLFFRKTDDGVYFADMRGTEEVPIWENPNPLSYFKSLKSDLPKWQQEKLRNEERDRLRQAGCECRLSFFEESEPDTGGLCKECEKMPAKDENSYLCEKCEKKLSEEYRKKWGTCRVCGKPIEFKDEVTHHISYAPWIIVPVHRGCHSKIHASKEYPILKPTQKAPHEDRMEKLVPCSLCEGKARVPIEWEGNAICSKCYNKEVKPKPSEITVGYLQKKSGWRLKRKPL